MSRLLSIMTLAFALCAGAALVVSCEPNIGIEQEKDAQSVDSSSELIRRVFAEREPSKEFEARVAEIEAQLIDAGDHEWAGVYRYDTGYGGKTLHLGPDGQFTLFESNCSFTFEYTGKARRVSGGFEFDFDRYPAWGGDKINLVRWGKRLYLVLDYQMDLFVMGVNSGWNARMGATMTLLRTDGEDQPVSGVPELPEPYSSMVRTDPLEPRMTSLRVEEKQVLLTFDMGRAHGLIAEMELRDPATRMRAEIQHVEGTNCEALVRLYGRNPDEQLAKLRSRVGKKWTERVWE